MIAIECTTNHRWRNNSTTPLVNELAPNMVLEYVSEDVSERLRWGMEFGVHGSYDTNALGPDSNPGRENPVDGADTIRHFSRANMSYMAPVGSGPILTVGLFNSCID